MKTQVRLKAKSSQVLKGKPPVRQRRDAWTMWLESLADERAAEETKNVVEGGIEGAIAFKTAPAEFNLDDGAFDGAVAVEQLEPEQLEPEQLELEQSEMELATAIAPPPNQDSLSQLHQMLLQEQTSPLPYKPLLESRLGQSLNEVVVYAGTPNVRAILTDLGAKAAHYERQILLTEPQPPLAIVAHEVVHALQSTSSAQPPNIQSSNIQSSNIQSSNTQSSNIPSSTPKPLSTSDSAEREAEQLSQEIVHSLDHNPSLSPWAPVVINAALPPLQIACLREAPPATVSESPTPQAAFSARTEPDRPVLSAPEPAQMVEPETSEAQATTEAALHPRDTAPVTADLAEVPALEVPPPPEPGVSAADIAARDAKLVAAEAALANATDVDEKVDAYAAAPPTLKASSYGSLGADMDALSKAENEAFQTEMPDFEAKLSGETEEPPAIAVESPTAEAVSLEDGTPAPAPAPEVSPTADLGVYTGNDALQRAVSRFTEGNSPQERASEIGDTLSDVQTTDPAVDTSPGPAPAVPLEGESDPQRIENQLLAGRDRATQARDEAQQAVLNGPGPEQVQPLVIEEAIPLEPLVPPTVTQLEAVPGIDDFSSREMPPEVNTAFDLTNQEPMQTSLAEAQTKVQEATDQRDRDRQEQVNTAQTEANRQTLAADAAQRAEVQTQRENIQAERQQTLNDQQAAVQSVEDDAETRRRDDQAAIDDRVSTDQATIRTDYAQAERESEAEVRDGERKAADKKKAAERDAENESWWDRAVNFVKEAFQALTDAIKAVFDVVRSAINQILDAVKEAAIALIDRAANFIKNAINEFSEFLQNAVNALLRDRFPELAAALTGFIANTARIATEAVDTVANDLKAGITALVEGLRAGLNAVLDALQAGLEFASALIQAVLSGDWGAVLRMLLEAVLKIIGIEPETFYQFIGQAQDTFQKIIDDPGAVVTNLLNAVKLGIQKFADNFLTHLQTGIIGWLTGALGGDLQIPTEFNLIGVLDLARQIMGLTLTFIRRIAVRLIGEENVERIEAIIEQIQTLISGGWAGLLEQITESLTNVKEMVIGQIKEFLVTRLILAAITKLATLFNPVGAIVQLVLTLWNVFNFLKENLQRMAQIVQTIMESISPIVAGVIDAAAGSIETVLANLLPVAISFLANLLGLSGLGRRVSRIIERLRERIENAIVNFIRRIGERLSRRRGTGDNSTPETEESNSLSHSAMATQAATELQRTEPNQTYEQLRANKIQLASSLADRYNRLLENGVEMTISFRSPSEDLEDADLDVHIKIAPNDEDLDVSIIDFLENELDHEISPIVAEIRLLVQTGAGEKNIREKLLQLREKVRHEFGTDIQIELASTGGSKVLLVYREASQEVRLARTTWRTVDDSYERDIQTWANQNLLERFQREQSRAARQPVGEEGSIEQTPPVIISVNSPTEETPSSSLRKGGHTELADIIGQGASSGPTGKMPRPIKQVAEIVWLPESVRGERSNSITLVARVGNQEMYLFEQKTRAFQGGHQIAKMFGGSDEPFNLTPQNSSMNNRDFETAESAARTKFIDYQNTQREVISRTTARHRGSIRRLKMIYSVEAQYKPEDNVAFSSDLLNEALNRLNDDLFTPEELQRSELRRTGSVAIPRRINETNIIEISISNIIDEPREPSREDRALGNELDTDRLIAGFVASVYGSHVVEEGSQVKFAVASRDIQAWIQQQQLQAGEAIFYESGRIDAVGTTGLITFEQLMAHIASELENQDASSELQQDTQLNLQYRTENQRFVFTQYVPRKPRL